MKETNPHLGILIVNSLTIITLLNDNMPLLSFVQTSRNFFLLWFPDSQASCSGYLFSFCKRKTWELLGILCWPTPAHYISNCFLSWAVCNLFYYLGSDTDHFGLKCLCIFSRGFLFFPRFVRILDLISQLDYWNYTSSHLNLKFAKSSLLMILFLLLFTEPPVHNLWTSHCLGLFVK